MNPAIQSFMGILPMKNYMDLVCQTRIGCLFGLAITAWLTNTALAWADVQFLPTPPDQGAPTGRQRGGATRGNCLAYQDLTALVPEIEGIVWSQTASATPHFFFYVPEALDNAIPLEFVVQDGSDNYIFQQQFSIDAPLGVLSIPIASNNPGLALGETYTWTLAIYCDAARPSASVSVSGTVKRVANTAAEASAETDPGVQLDQIQQYAAAGIWHEALMLAIALQQSEPDNANYQQTLESLLAQAGLTNVA